jgi:cation:H+ antiporter
MLLAWLQLFGGLILLIFGGDFIVRSSVKIATFLRVSPMVVGLTIVSFGTSFPELVVSVNAALSGYPDISIGNVVGSNIANLALVLGLTTLIRPMNVARHNILFDWPFMLLVTFGFVLLSLDNFLVRWEGVFLLVSLFAYNIWSVLQGRTSFDDEIYQEKPLYTEVLRSVVILIVSLVALVFGGDLIIDGAVSIARALDIQERVIAGTIIALGTSVPELATSLIALRKNEMGLSIGNLIGSNIFNILGILGVTSILTDIYVTQAVFEFDFYWVVLIPLVVLPVLVFNQKIGRILGALLLLSYFTYLYLVF